MLLTLKGTKVLSLNFIQVGSPLGDDADFWVLDEPEEAVGAEADSYTLKFHVAYGETGSERYAIIFDFNSKLPSQALEINLKYIAEFEANEVITEKFKESIFPRQNSPAIAFPFLRAFVSNLLLSSGYRPMILPSINFQALDKAGDEKLQAGVEKT